MSNYQRTSPQSVKAAQFADLIRDLCATYFQRTLSAKTDTLITVTAVTLSPDLQYATAWIRVFPAQKNASILNHLHRYEKEFQRNLHHDIQRKFIPHLKIELDTTDEDSNHIDTLLGLIQPH